jgi:hypothetical protein
LGTPSHHPSGLTAAQYYEDYVWEGRAVLRGSREDPDIWLARVGTIYLLCRSHIEGIRFLEAHAPIALLLRYAQKEAVPVLSGPRAPRRHRRRRYFAKGALADVRA